MEGTQQIRGIQRALDYIEGNLEVRIVLEDLSAEAGYSPSYFVWIFRAATGQTPIEYVRRRRMTEAAKAILNGGDLVDIAHRFGFSAQDTFTRSFRDTIGLPPGQFRQSKGTSGTYTSALDLQREGGPVMDGVFSDIRYESLKTMRVASSCIISLSPEVQVTQYLPIWCRERGVEGTRAFGFDYPVSHELEKKGFRGYEYCMVVPGNIEATEAVTIKDIPANDYAVLRIADPFSLPFERIPMGWKRLRDWCLAHENVPTTSRDKYWLEEVVKDDDGNIHMDCYFPTK
jgi:AraC-like DNA-binding protein/predicted transcriptional regulator YdeE